MLASGGDAPGINDFIGNIYKLNKNNDSEFFYSEYGFNGIYDNKIKRLEMDDYAILFDVHSSIIKCGRFPEFETNMEKRKIVIDKLREFDKVIIMGGNGTKKAAQIISRNGINVTFIPLTIDNDVKETQETLGYATALETIVNLVNQASYSIKAHGSVLLVEVMGRGCDDLINNSFNLSNAHIKVIDNEYNPKKLKEDIMKQYEKFGHCIVLVREKLSKYTFDDYYVAAHENPTSTRSLILGHLQRGGATSIGDKLLAFQMAKKTIETFDKDGSFDIIKIDGKILANKL